MTEHIGHSITSRRLEERLIRVWETVQDEADSYHYELTTFPLSSIERLRSDGQDTSLIILRSGVSIRVALPHERLEQRIYLPNLREDGGWTIDLCAVTGKTALPPIKAGDKAEDGSIYLGLHEDREWYVADKDASVVMTFNDAAQYAKNLKAHGHSDWILPSQTVLEKMFRNKTVGAFRKTFSEGGNNHTGWYWSSTTQGSDQAIEVPFNQASGKGGNFSITDTVSVRCVRSVPRQAKMNPGG